MATLCGLLLTILPAPWLHEHTGEYFHDHGFGLVHAHWLMDSSDQPLLQEPKDDVRYLDWLNVHNSSGGPDAALGIHQGHAVITYWNGPLTTATDTPRAHGPPWPANLSLRSPPTCTPPAATPHS